MSIMRISELVTQATSKLHELGYAPRTTKYYVITWNQFEKFCATRGITEYDASLSADFLHGYLKEDETRPSIKAVTFQRKNGIMKMLYTFYTQGSWQKGRAFQPQPLSSNFIDFLSAQDAALVKKAYSQCSRETVREFCERFMRFLISQDIETLSQLTNTHISNYLLQFNGHAKSTIRGELSRFRQTLKSMYLLQYTAEDLSVYVPSYHLGQADSMTKIWKSDELAQLIDTVDNANPKGKRDLAFILFASELGMRSIDIRNLKLSDIDWEQCCVTFVQSKTGKTNKLPLSEKLGTAIIDYLRMRPQTASSYLFINLAPPYEQMARFNGAFQRYTRRAGIHVEPQAHHGLHSLRATLATRLLENDVAADVIVPFLGHSDQHSLHRYIRLDIENLRKCALSFEDGELI